MSTCEPSGGMALGIGWGQMGMKWLYGLKENHEIEMVQPTEEN
jgi:hypothetical protein